MEHHHSPCNYQATRNHPNNNNNNNNNNDNNSKRLPFWCHVCKIDLQSRKNLEEHKSGRRHLKKESKCPSSSSSCYFPSFINEEELFENLLVRGKYQNVVVLTGAGVSTASGIPDFRSPRNGVFSTIRNKFKNRFPFVCTESEMILSRDFANQYPAVFQTGVLPMIENLIVRPTSSSSSIMPTETHRFCAWLHQRGILRRVYTQNVDGLHLHPSLSDLIDENLVVECHGSIRDYGTIVLYGDNLPKRFYDCCNEDFPVTGGGKVDLLLVFGTSLQVKPFCAIPNLVPRGCVRVLVNRSLSDYTTPNYYPQEEGGTSNIRIGNRKFVTTKNLWSSGRDCNTNNKIRKKRWTQLVVEGDSDDFVKRLLSHTNNNIIKKDIHT